MFEFARSISFILMPTLQIRCIEGHTTSVLISTCSLTRPNYALFDLFGRYIFKYPTITAETLLISEPSDQTDSNISVYSFDN